MLRLHETLIGPASEAVMWAPERGAWQLTLEDGSGHALDAAPFVVR